jgi:hypothetical protein
MLGGRGVFLPRSRHHPRAARAKALLRLESPIFLLFV